MTGARAAARERDRSQRAILKEAKLRAAQDFISARLEEIAKYFTEPVKLTLVVRNPAYGDGRRDVLLGDDDFEQAVEAGRRLLKTGQETKA